MTAPLGGLIQAVLFLLVCGIVGWQFMDSPSFMRLVPWVVFVLGAIRVVTSGTAYFASRRNA